MHLPFYERIWLVFAAAILVLFVSVVSVGAVMTARALPGHAETVDPERVLQEDPRFSRPRMEQVSPGVYEAYVVARMFSFAPQEIRVPSGSRVTFLITSPDVIHGFEIARTNVNVMVMPGYVTRVTARFKDPGEYLILCNEYCGLGHQVMSARLIVE